MSQLPPAADSPSTLDLFLDGLLVEPALGAFERNIKSDPSLAAQVELQRRIDTRLKALFAYAGPVVLAPPVSESVAGEPLSIDKPLSIAPATQLAGNIAGKRSGNRVAVFGRWGAYAAIAASLLVAFTYMYWPRNDLKYIAPDEIYRRLATTGWQPSFICETDAQFVDAVRKHLGDAVLIPASTVGVVLDGWGYADGYDGTPISPKTMFLLTHADGEKVLVLMDLASNDTDVKLSKLAKGLHLFRREVDGVVLYEISPLPTERVISKAIAK